MKDYYYILGINKRATAAEIQRAYQKLSLKFHPEKNGHDPFFEGHYQQIKEAYQVLSDDHKRFRYDKALGDELSAEVDKILDGPAPTISSFFASKKASQKGEVLTISWEVLNAEEVHIDMIGDVASNGTQTIRLMESTTTKEYLTIELRASNRYSDKISTKTLSIKNLAYSPQEAALKRRQEVVLDKKNKTIEETSKPVSKKKKTTKQKNTRKPTSNKSSSNKQSINRRREEGAAYILIAVMFFIIVIMLYIIHSINPIF
ncbi:J domain-containing protein [Aureispira anguillae]|uniref:J domain-containing protein n=1 Tax=Aureispira anguillae TaxID=2864201 RepID=A0A915YAY5_9BACT|nr:J domain-containing protein [Aureispira anguillae]BDS09630.1 J domain-containing protein [Aureispira anguillae]